MNLAAVAYALSAGAFGILYVLDSRGAGRMWFTGIVISALLAGFA